MRAMSAEKLPRSGAKRENLRAKGQFWTPDWTADFMAAYALRDKPGEMLDPALGQGAFFLAAKRHALSRDYALKLHGRDVDRTILGLAKTAGLTDEDLGRVEFRDFVLDPPDSLFPAIIANPPYIRHHRLPQSYKEKLRDFAQKTTGGRIDGRAGLHVYFLIRALLSLAPGGRLAFIVSADICEGVFAPALWRWICGKYKLDALVMFAQEAAPFPDVDTNALVCLIQNTPPSPYFQWSRCVKPCSVELAALAEGKPIPAGGNLTIHCREISEALVTGISRPPADHSRARFTLGDFATVMRGIVTGDNDFFFMTAARARHLGIPEAFLVKALGRTRDVEGDSFDAHDIKRLEAKGRPTRLLNVNGMAFGSLPQEVRKYLLEGEARGLPQKTLIKTRTPWYRMETRKIPPILFAYLGRRDVRFIRNEAKVVPLTCLLCVYPKRSDSAFVEGLWKVLSNSETVANLRMVGKSYGGDAIKVEPRALERLPLPEKLVVENGLAGAMSPKQQALNFGGL
jgi:hypothetical protein